MKSSPAVLGPVSAVAAAMLLSGCVTVTAENAEDPYEDFNRSMYAFNDGLDRSIVEPVAKGYRAITNEPIRGGVNNFLDNLGEPVTFANEVLQGKIGNAAGTVGRFVVNTTVGIAGIFNPAEAIGIKRTDEDFGQTLGVWGVPAGPYLVLPFIGPSSPRDGFGTLADFFVDPVNYVEFDKDNEIRFGFAIANGLVAREEAIETFDTVREQVDPYTTVRRFYVRSRAAAIGSSEPELRTIEDVPDFELDF
jgi:phospholipid-binding lipoprotein MlaA